MSEELQKCVLKVGIYCDGCKKDVRKVLTMIEGVNQVDIDAEKGMAVVSGKVDPDILKKRLKKILNKHAEVISIVTPKK